jgi:hypothetical protein
MESRQRSIRQFFVTNPEQLEKKNRIDVNTTEERRHENAQISKPKDSQSEVVCSSSFISADAHPLDIGLHIGKSVADLLRNAWTPNNRHIMSYSQHLKQGKLEKRYFKTSDLEKFPWVAYRDFSKVVYCRFCALCLTRNTGGAYKGIPLGCLVAKPLQSFAKLSGKDGAIS